MADIEGHVRGPIMAPLTGKLVDPPEQISNGSQSQAPTTDPTSQGYPKIIPETRSGPGRTLIVCFDGTGNQFANDNSNIVKFLSLLKKDDPSKQLVYYQSGIGTYTTPDIPSPIKSQFWKWFDLVFASNLPAHIMSGYEFLMQSYKSGDKICIFGFSRGAYTARCLAGMLHKVGLLPVNNFQQVPFAYKIYTWGEDAVGWERSSQFKEAYSIPVPIEFVGVWDTVDSIGILTKRLAFTTSNTIVRNFRHAISLDERRAKFKINQWNRQTEKERQLMRGISGTTSFAKEELSPPPDKMVEPSTEISIGRFNKMPLPPPGRQQTLEDPADSQFDVLERENADTGKTKVQEVWFMGCHSDVGGGSVSNKERHSLARIPLRWMVRECFLAKTGILFIADKLRDIGMDPLTLLPDPLTLHPIRSRPPQLSVTDEPIRSRPRVPIPITLRSTNVKLPGDVGEGKKSIKERLLDLVGLTKRRVVIPQPTPFLGSEEAEDLADALAPMYDELELDKAWWGVEWMFLPFRVQRGLDQWLTKWRFNNGAPREIIAQADANGVQTFNVHRTVKLRMHAQYEDERRRRKGDKYEPRAKYTASPVFID